MGGTLDSRHARTRAAALGVAAFGVLLTITLAAGSSPASAATLVVDNNSGDPLVEGSLPFRVAESNDGDVITFDPAVFNAGAPQTITLDDRLDVDKNLDIQGPGRDVLTVTVADPADRVLQVADFTDPLLQVSGLTITGSNSDAIFVSAGESLALDDVLITGNATGINASSAGSISIVDSDIDEQAGTGVRVVGAASVNVQNSGFSTNVGNALELSNAGAVTLNSVTVDSALAATPAGRGITLINGSGAVTFTDVDVVDQDATGGTGMRFVSVAGDVNIVDSSVSGSDSHGISFDGTTGAVTMSNSSSSANDRGGITVQNDADLTFTSVVTDSNGEGGVLGFGVNELTLTSHSADSNEAPGLNVTDIGELDIVGGSFDMNGEPAPAFGSQGIALANIVGTATINNASVSNNTRDGVTSSGSDVRIIGGTSITDNAMNGISHQNGGSLTITDAVVTDNGRDGVLAIASSSVAVTTSQLERNDEAGALLGSGISASGLTGPFSIDGSTISRNGLNGLRITDSAGEITIEDTTFALNLEAGIDLGVSGDVGDVTIIGGRGELNGGAALGLVDAGGVQITDFTVLSNHRADGVGGAAAGPAEGAGIDARSVDSFALANSSVGLNGGIGVYVDAGGAVSVDDSTIVDNQAHGAFVAGVTSFSSAGLTVTSNADNGLFIDSPTEATISDFTATSNDGDGVAVNDPVGAITIDESTFSDQGESGVSIFGGVAAASLEITDGDFDSNREGVSVTGTTDLTVRDTEFDDHTSEGVGTNGATGDVLVEDSRFVGNGDGVSTFDSVGDVTISRSFFDDTSDSAVEIVGHVGDTSFEQSVITSTNRGVVVENATGAVSVDRSAFFENGASATVRADSLVRVTDGSDGLTIINSTFTSNINSFPIVDTSGTEVTVAHSSFENNSVFTAISADADLTLDHSIILIAGQGTSFELVTPTGGPAPSVTARYSIVEEGTGLGGTNIETFQTVTQFDRGAGDASAALVPTVGSLAIDAGDPNISGAPATDQRGDARIVEVIDIGAVETELAIPALISVSPGRFADTRPAGVTIDDRFVADGKLAAGEEYRVEIAGRGDVPADAAGVVMNVTAVAAEGTGFVTVHPCVTPRPLSSSLNYTEGVNLGNEVIAGLSGDGDVCLFTFEAAHLTVDVTGYVPAGSSTTSITPLRFLDTRPAGETFDDDDLGAGKSSAGGTVRLDIAGRGGIPADAAAVIVNVTAVGATDTGFVTVHPCVDPIPLASSLNHVTGVNRGNELVASLDADGGICLFTSASIHLTADVVGYLPAGSSVEAVAPARVLDTRPGAATVDNVSAGDGRLSAGEEIVVAIGGRAGVPADASAVIVNVTAIGAEGTGFVTVHPCLDPTPLSSSLNYVEGVNGANEIIALLDDDGDLCLFTFESSHLAVDVVGYL